MKNSFFAAGNAEQLNAPQ